MMRWMDSYWKKDFVEGAASALWESAWYSEREDKPPPRHRTPPLDAYVAAGELIGRLEQLNDASIYVLGARATEAEGKSWEDDPVNGEEFKSDLALEAVGHGVSWFDDHAAFPLEIPAMEYYAEIPRASGRAR